MSGDSKPLAGVDDLAVTALGEIWMAVFAFPEAWPIAEFIFGKQCQPSEIIQAGESWIELAGTLSTATSRIDADTGASRFPESAWTGKDRAAFDAHVSDYVGQLYADQVAALVVGGVTVAVGVLLAILVICYCVVATLLAVMAALYFTLLGFAVTAPAAADLQEVAVEVCEESESALTEFAETIDRISDTGARLIGGALVLDTLGQITTGNVDVFKDLVQAVVYTGLDTVTGLVSKTEQDRTSDGIGNANTAVRAVALGYGTGSTFSGTETVDAAGSAATNGAWDQGGDAWK
jgi:hypothetical protein